MDGATREAPVARNDYFLRMRVLKLRWMGMEDEAEQLLELIDHRPHCLTAATSALLPCEPIDTD